MKFEFISLNFCFSFKQEAQGHELILLLIFVRQSWVEKPEEDTKLHILKK